MADSWGTFTCTTPKWLSTIVKMQWYFQFQSDMHNYTDLLFCTAICSGAWLQDQESLSPVIRSFECEILHIITCKRYTDVSWSQWMKRGLRVVYCPTSLYASVHIYTDVSWAQWMKRGLRVVYSPTSLYASVHILVVMTAWMKENLDK